MSSDATELLRRDALTWQPLRFLTLYRLTLAGLLVVLFLFAPRYTSFGGHDPGLFLIAASAYLLFSLAAAFATRLRRPAYGTQVFTQVMTDILAITLLLHAGGGLQSGLGILLVVAVAAGGLLMPGRMAFLFAAVATLAILGEYGYSILGAGREVAGAGYTQAGLLGATLFATATLAWFLARRIRESEDLAERRGVDLANLSRLNEYIIQQMQSGVLVVGPEGRIHLANHTARRMLNLPPQNGMPALDETSPELAARLRDWRGNPAGEIQAFHPGGGGAALLPRFTRLGTLGAATLVFLEDSAALARQARQIRLASLGKLTASIAHEIRNPLGAISHAGQLLGESPRLDSSDQRLTEIIRSHSQRMNTIIENILQLSRRGPSHPRRLELAPWLEQFVEEWGHGGDGWSADLQPAPHDSGAAVYFDPGHLHQILWNLCRNALQHGGRDGGAARLTLRWGILPESRLPFLDVVDDGPGIEPGVAEHIFDPFFTTAAGGTGLGLYLARELCEYNQARLDYQAEAGGGSCFRITFARPPE